VSRRETAIGITRRTPGECSAQHLLAINRGHWAIESLHDTLDWNDDADRGRIRTGNGPENVTRLRRFALAVLRSFQTTTPRTRT